MIHTLYLGPWTIEIEQELIEVPPATLAPDPAWRYVDAAGHGHFWTSDGYPTLTVVDGRRWYCADCAEDHVERHWACPLCGEEITPGTTSGELLGSTYLRGPVTMTVEHRPETSTPAYRRRWHLVGADAEEVLADPVTALPVVTARLAPDEITYGDR